MPDKRGKGARCDLGNLYNNPPFLTKNRPKVSSLQDEGTGSKVTKAVPKKTGRFFLKMLPGRHGAAFFATGRGRRKNFRGGAGQGVKSSGQGNY